VHAVEAYGRVGVWLRSFLTWTVYGGELTAAPQAKSPSYPLNGDWVAPPPQLVLPLPGVDPLYFRHPSGNVVSKPTTTIGFRSWQDDFKMGIK